MRLREYEIKCRGGSHVSAIMKEWFSHPVPLDLSILVI